MARAWRSLRGEWQSAPSIRMGDEVVSAALSCQSGSVAVGGISPSPRLLTAGGSASTAGSQFGQGRLQLREWSRHYFADSCGDAPDAYAAWPLLDRTLSFTVELDDTGCGCNLAVYLASMQQNTQEGTCDYYCDANAVCGARCDEIAPMEANLYAFHSVAHHYDDGSGQGGGIGGSHGSNSGAYGPTNDATIDTRRAFRVHNIFGAAPLRSRH